MPRTRAGEKTRSPVQSKCDVDRLKQGLETCAAYGKVCNPKTGRCTNKITTPKGRNRSASPKSVDLTHSQTSPSGKRARRQSPNVLRYPGPKMSPITKTISAVGDVFTNKDERKIALEIVQSESANVKCRLSSMIRNALLLPKTSASDIMMLLGEFPSVRKQSNIGIALKFSFETCNPKWDNSQETERVLYEKVVNPLYLNGNTPHIMLMLGSFTCDNFTDIIHTDCRTLNNLTELEYRVCKMRYDNLINMGILIKEKDGTHTGDLDYAQLMCANKLTATMLERGLTDTLSNILGKKAKAGEPFLYMTDVLFQIFWTLMCFQDVGFGHNDLHVGNVWIDMLPAAETYYYQATFNGVLYTWKLITPAFVKLYDFDRAGKVATQYNDFTWTNSYLTSGKICEEFGSCDDFAPFFDARAILAYVHFYYGQNDLQLNDFMAWTRKNLPIAYEGFFDSFAGNYTHYWCKNNSASNGKLCDRGSAPPSYLPSLLVSGMKEYLISNDEVPAGAQVWKLPSFTMPGGWWFW